MNKFLFLCLLGVGSISKALPVIDEALSTGTQSLKVYPDHKTHGVYWYIPTSIEPWSRDNRHVSSLFKSDEKLSFIFRGQASVSEDVLYDVAKSLGTSVRNLTPIAYDYSRNLVCEDVFAGAVTWAFPKMIGNYLEVVPVSLRTTDRSMIEELAYHIENGGLACTVEVGFKGVYTGYDLLISANLRDVYNRFEANAHAGGLWWEVDIHTLLETLIRDGSIVIKKYEDQTVVLRESDKKVQSAMDEIIKKITEAMFTPMLKLPQGSLSGRGKAWSLRADYIRQTISFNLTARLNSQFVNVKDSQIALRLSTK